MITNKQGEEFRMSSPSRSSGRAIMRVVDEDEGDAEVYVTREVLLALLSEFDKLMVPPPRPIKPGDILHSKIASSPGLQDYVYTVAHPVPDAIGRVLLGRKGEGVFGDEVVWVLIDPSNWLHADGAKVAAP